MLCLYCVKPKPFHREKTTRWCVTDTPQRPQVLYGDTDSMFVRLPGHSKAGPGHSRFVHVWKDFDGVDGDF